VASISCDNLTFSYPGSAPALADFCLSLPAGARCLLVGANGAGKSTLLRLVAGKGLVDPDRLRVLGRPPFHDLSLTSGGDLAFLGPQWRRDAGGSAGGSAALQGDVAAGDMIDNAAQAAARDGFPIPEGRQVALEILLDVDRTWRMARVSDGQRRRVQICLGLLRPPRVLLLDEVTVDMDVCGRADLLDWLRAESEASGKDGRPALSVLYATHILDGLEAGGARAVRPISAHSSVQSSTCPDTSIHPSVVPSIPPPSPGPPTCATSAATAGSAAAAPSPMSRPDPRRLPAPPAPCSGQSSGG